MRDLEYLNSIYESLEEGIGIKTTKLKPFYDSATGYEFNVRIPAIFQRIHVSFAQLAGCHIQLIILEITAEDPFFNVCDLFASGIVDEPAFSLFAVEEVARNNQLILSGIQIVPTERAALHGGVPSV